MKFLYTLFAVLFIATVGLRAEKVYVFFDPSCSEQVSYEQDYGPGQFVDYLTYHFSLGSQDRLILEVGNQAGQILNYLPEGTLKCGDPRLNREFAKRINAGQDEVYIIGWAPQPNTYRVDRVEMAATLEIQGNAFTYASKLTGFQFDADNAIIGENLAYNNPGAKVYFEGKESGICSGTFLFRQLKPTSSYPVIDLKFSPEIGVVERHLGSDGVNSNPGGTITGKSVNGFDFNLYRKSVCNPGGTAASPPAANTNAVAPGTYSNQPVYTPPTVVLPTTPQPESAAAQAVAPGVTTNVTHTVAKGETLYAISRKYGTSVDAIRSTNGLTGNVVYPGQQLTVGTTTTQAVAMAPEATATPQPATVPTLPYNPGNIASANPQAAQPTPYGSVQEPRSGDAVYGEDIHVVQPGETVASLALKYGYTTAKFREMNNLGPNDFIRVGEQLKTSPCNCPVVPAAASTPATAPTSYGMAPEAPQPYSPQPTLAPVASPMAPVTTPRPQQAGIPVNGGVPTYTPPAEVPQAAPTISNAPSFGQIVPNAAAPPSTTLNQLEARSGAAPATTDPSAFGARPANIPTPAPAPAPTSYGSAPASPNTFGTPLGAASAAPSNAAAQPSNRAFHIVQAGETPFAIARRYNLTTAKLRELNNLAPTDVIVPFQKLYVN